jgi:hypothetical protein
MAFPFQETALPAAARTIAPINAINETDKQPLNAFPIMRR